MLAVVGVYLHVHRGADVDLFEVPSVVWWEVVVRQANGLDGGAPWDARGRLQRDIAAGVKGAHFFVCFLTCRRGLLTYPGAGLGRRSGGEGQPR